MSPRRSKRTSRRLKLCRWAKVRSTTQRTRPRPEPCRSGGGRSGLDAPLAQEAAVLVVVVAAVGDDAGREAGPAGDRRHRLQQRDQLGDVVAIAAGERPGERDPARLDEQVVLGARSGSVNRARARLGAPFLACTWLESTTARDQSSSPAARSLASSSACRRSHTPACCHSSRRRQQVTPEPKPSSCGRCFQAIPVCSTNRIPCNLDGRGAASGPGSGSAAPSSAAAARRAPTARRRRSTVRRPLAPLSA